jgi:hypothetical protein
MTTAMGIKKSPREFADLAVIIKNPFNSDQGMKGTNVSMRQTPPRVQHTRITL